jgi:hypothetical protein
VKLTPRPPLDAAGWAALEASLPGPLPDDIAALLGGDGCGNDRVVDIDRDLVLAIGPTRSLLTRLWGALRGR